MPWQHGCDGCDEDVWWMPTSDVVMSLRLTWTLEHGSARYPDPGLVGIQPPAPTVLSTLHQTGLHLNLMHIIGRARHLDTALAQ